MLETEKGHLLSPATLLAHEFEHGVDAETNYEQYKADAKTKVPSYGNENERKVITNEEQDIAKAHGEIGNDEVTRTDHGGVYVRIMYMTPKQIERYIRKARTEKLDESGLVVGTN